MGYSPPLNGIFLSQVKVIAEDQVEWKDKVFVSEPFSQLPPLATTSCNIEDGGEYTQHYINTIVTDTSFCILFII